MGLIFQLLSGSEVDMTTSMHPAKREPGWQLRPEEESQRKGDLIPGTVDRADSDASLEDSCAANTSGPSRARRVVAYRVILPLLVTVAGGVAVVSIVRLGEREPQGPSGLRGPSAPARLAREETAASIRKRLFTETDLLARGRIVEQVYRGRIVVAWRGKLIRYPEKGKSHGLWILVLRELKTHVLFRLFTADDASRYRPGDCVTVVLAEILDIGADGVIELGDSPSADSPTLDPWPCEG